MADPNTRQGKRTPVTLKIKFKSETLEQFIERYAVDVSQGGIFIRTKEPLAVGTAMKFEFQLRDASPLIAGEGTVVWTRENDPSRPAIAPGMGVRFDRLAEGSQVVLEKILAEKAKQAPQRGGEIVTKPPMFTDAPTRVAPAPVQDALLGPAGSKGSRSRSDSDRTPLPKPTPFHSDADEFGAEAFEEATKVRALDELVAATAEAQAAGEELLRRPSEHATPSRNVVATVRAGASASAPPPAPAPVPAAPAPHVEDRDSAPALPEVPEPIARISKPESIQPATPVPTKLGIEAPRIVRPSAPPISQPLAEPGRAARPSAQPQTNPIESPPPQPKSSAPLVIGLLVVVAAGLAAVWYFVLRAPAAEQVANEQTTAAHQPAVAPTPPVPATPGSAATPKTPAVDTEIAANAANATVTVVDTGESGPAPYKAKLEKAKHYKVRVEAPGYVAQELDVTAGQDQSAKLVAKPHVLAITSSPSGAGIAIDNFAIGHLTPFEYQLSAAQAAKPKLRITLRKSGFKTGDSIVDPSQFQEDDKRVIATVDIRLAVAPVAVVHTPSTGSTGATTGTPPDAGTTATGSNDSGTTGTTPDNGQTPTPTPTPPSTDTPPATPPPATPPPATPPSATPPPAPSPSGSASASNEPTPSWAKPN